MINTTRNGGGFPSENKYIIGLPGGPAGPFYSIVESSGKVIALQIIERDIAERIIRGLEMLDREEKTND